MRTLIRGMAAEKAIIVSTHLLEEVEAICTRAVIIDRGQIVADGTPAELLARSRYHNAVTVGAARGAARRGTGENPRALERCRRRDRGFERRDPDHGPSPARTRCRSRTSARSLWREKWDVKELHAEAGRLDEVFRAITTHDAVRTKAVPA